MGLDMGVVRMGVEQFRPQHDSCERVSRQSGKKMEVGVGLARQ